MPSYMMLFKFNSAQNAQLFWTNANNQGMQPANVTVPSGWVGPSGPSTGIGQPSSQPSTDNSYVLIYSPTQTTPFPGYRPDLVFDTSTRQPLFVSPNIDPATITIMDGDNAIFYRGLPSQEWQPPPPTPMSDPIEFTPIYPPRDALNEFYKQYLQQIADFPSDPNVMRDAQSDLEPPAQPKAPIEQQDLPSIPIPEPYRNPYDVTDPVNFPKIFPEIAPDPSSPVFRNPDTDPTLDPDIVIQPPRNVAPGEFKDLPQQHLYPYQPFKISVEGPSGGGSGGFIFIGIEAAQQSGQSGVTVSAIFHWSTNGINWNIASVDALSSGLWFAPAVEYANGTFFGSLQQYPAFNAVGIYSTDGQNWVTVYTAPTNFAFSFNSALSAWVVGGVVVQTVPKVMTSAVADDTASGPLADASQTVVTDTFNKAANPLIGGITAINGDFTPGGFQYTTTPLTAAIVAGGTGQPQPWSGATWFTTLTFDNAGSQDVGNNDTLYARVIGKTLIS